MDWRMLISHHLSLYLLLCIPPRRSAPYIPTRRRRKRLAWHPNRLKLWPGDLSGSPVMLRCECHFFGRFYEMVSSRCYMMVCIYIYIQVYLHNDIITYIYIYNVVYMICRYIVCQCWCQWWCSYVLAVYRFLYCFETLAEKPEYQVLSPRRLIMTYQLWVIFQCVLEWIDVERKARHGWSCRNPPSNSDVWCLGGMSWQSSKFATNRTVFLEISMNDSLKHVEALWKSYRRMGGMRPKFLVCPNWPWWVGTGTRCWEIYGS